MTERAPTDPFEFSGGALCLDFANTLGDRPRSRNETLSSPVDLYRWGGAAGILDPGEEARLTRESERRPRAARTVFRRALVIRELIYRIFAKLAAGDRPAGDDLEELNSALARSLRNLRVEPGGKGFVWTWADPGPALDHLLWPVARSTAELLTSEDVERIRECDSDRCSWLFIDRSRARRRRWCDMKTCGNRAKARRHYRRRRGSAGTG